MRHSRLAGFGLFSLAALGAQPAHAQDMGTDFGHPGQFIISAERLFGFSVASTKTDNNGTTGTVSATEFSFAATAPATVYQAPRGAFDYGVASNFTVGGSVAYSHTSTRVKNNAGVEADGPTTTAFLFAPRGGYALGLGTHFAFWSRVGFSYFNQTVSTTNVAGGTTSNSTHGISLNLEPMFVALPVQNFGVVFGPVIDLPLSGSTSQEVTQGGSSATTSQDTKITSFGVTVGVLGAF